MSSAKNSATPTGSNPVKNAGHGARPRRRAPNEEISPAQRQSTPTPQVGFGLLSTQAAAASRPTQANGMAPGGGGDTSAAGLLRALPVALVDVFWGSGILADIAFWKESGSATATCTTDARKSQHNKRRGVSLRTSRRARSMRPDDATVRAHRRRARRHTRQRSSRRRGSVRMLAGSCSDCPDRRAACAVYSRAR